MRAPCAVRPAGARPPQLTPLPSDRPPARSFSSNSATLTAHRAAVSTPHSASSGAGDSPSLAERRRRKRAPHIRIEDSAHSPPPRSRARLGPHATGATAGTRAAAGSAPSGSSPSDEDSPHASSGHAEEAEEGEEGMVGALSASQRRESAADRAPGLSTSDQRRDGVITGSGGTAPFLEPDPDLKKATPSKVQHAPRRRFSPLPADSLESPLAVKSHLQDGEALGEHGLAPADGHVEHPELDAEVQDAEPMHFDFSEALLSTFPSPANKARTSSAKGRREGNQADSSMDSILDGVNPASPLAKSVNACPSGGAHAVADAETAASMALAASAAAGAMSPPPVPNRSPAARKGGSAQRFHQLRNVRRGASPAASAAAAAVSGEAMEGSKQPLVFASPHGSPSGRAATSQASAANTPPQVERPVTRSRGRKVMRQVAAS